jgi:hypothetical protein
MLKELSETGRIAESNVAAETLPIADSRVLVTANCGLPELYEKEAFNWTVEFPPGIE